MFGKIYEQIYDSSIAEDWTIRTVFQDFIVLSDINGVVDMTPEAIARRTNVPLEIVQKAIVALEAPDPKSRSPEENGARIRRLDEHRDWGWEIVNHHKYRYIASEEQRREKTKIRTRKWRDNKEKRIGDAPVTLSNAGDAMQKQKQKQKQKQMELVQEVLVVPPSLRNPETERAWGEWLAHRSEIRKKVTPQSAKQNFKQLEEWGPTRWVAAIEHSIGNGWQGLFEPKVNGSPKPQKYVPNI